MQRATTTHVRHDPDLQALGRRMVVHGSIWMMGGTGLLGLAIYLGASSVISAVAVAAAVVGLLDILRGVAKR